MCYDVSLSKAKSITSYISNLEVDANFSYDDDLNLHIQAQSHRKYPVIIFEDGQYKLKAFEWGVIADYMDTPEKIKKTRSSMCNARSEKIIDDKKSYWHRIRKTRCLIPVTGIFEHREVKGFKNKIPYHVWLKERSLFCIPGLYHFPNRADVETGEIVGTFTLVTRAANEVMAQIHNGGDQAYRMPLFLPKELELQWLQPGLTDAEIKHILDFEMPSGELEYTPVYTIRTTKERPDQKSKLDAYEWPNLPPLGNDNGIAQIDLFG